jgi:hypothetical protein
VTDVHGSQVALDAIPVTPEDADRPLGPSPLQDRTLSIDDVFKASDVREEDLDVAEWGGKIRIRSLGLDSMRRVNAQSTLPDGKTDLLEAMVWMVIEGCVDPAFGPEHRKALGEKGLDVLSKISDAVTSLSGMGEEAISNAELAFRDASGPGV